MAKAGDVIGNYRLLEELASGSFGSVYQGVHTILTTRVVAVKILHTYLHSTQESDSFFHEARLLEALQHPHILRIFDVGMHEKLPYIVTAYAPGGSLRRYLQSQNGKPLPLNEAITILQQIAQALYYAHQQNIIHRDLKPENILFDAQGSILLADFGISTILGSLTLHQTSLYGTPAYMSPEQFKGEVSRESDQYALACIAYELLTGQKPFTAPDAIALGFKHLMEQAVPPQKLNANLPEYISQAIMQALNKERKQRFHDELTFISALQTLPKTSQQWYIEGNTLSDLERFEEALQAYDQAILLDPTNLFAHQNRGKTLQDLERFDEALQAYDQAMLLDPTDALTYQNRGNALHNLERYDEALQAYDQAIILDPNDALVYRNKGNTFYNLERYDEALQTCNQAILLDPTDALTHQNRGKTLHSLERYDEALQAYDQAMLLDPTDALAYHNKGNALQNLARYDEALQAYDQAILLDPTDTLAYFNKGYALDELQRYDEALQAYDQAILLDPTYVDNYINKGVTLHHLQRYDEAIAAYDQAILLDPTSAAAYKNKGDTLHYLQRYREAKKAYQKAREPGYT